MPVCIHATAFLCSVYVNKKGTLGPCHIAVRRLRSFTHTELPSLPIYREISRKYSKINSISRSPAFDLQSPAKESVFSAYFSICLPAHCFASWESSTVHGKCREQPSGDYTRRI